MSKNQSQEFERYSDALRSQPLNLLLKPGLFISNDRDRLVKSDNSDLYNAFMHFDKENVNRNKDYLNMFIYSDYIEKYYTDLLLQDTKHYEFAFNDFKAVSDNLLKIVNIFYQIQIQKESELGDNVNDDPEYLFVRKYVDLHVRLKGNGFADFQLYYDDFFKPLFYEINENILVLDNKFRLGVEISSALTLLNTRILNSISHADAFSNKRKIDDVENSLLGLDKINEKIKKLTSHNK